MPPAEADIAGQNFAAASMTDDANARLTYVGNGLGAAGNALLGATGFAGLAETAAGTLFDGSLGGVASGVPSTTGIADSTVSLSGSSPSQLARSWQGSGSYPGVDAWTDTNLSQGTYVVGSAPGQSEFYTTLDGFNSTDGTAQDYYQNMQISPNTTNPSYPPYRSGVTIYQVNTDGVPAASSNALANPQFGPGGAPQLFIPGYQNSLTPVYSIPFK